MKRTFQFFICFVFLVVAISVRADGVAAFKAGDYDRAFRLWFMALNESSDNAEANFGLGRIILEGLGSTKQNDKEGLDYLIQAVEQGSQDGALYLADAYKNGQFLDANDRSQLEYLEKAEELGVKGLSNRIASLIKKLEGAVSAKACKTYSKKDRKSAYLVAQCIDKGFLNGRASDFYKVAFREGNNDAFLKAARSLLDPVSPDYDLKFMAQYLLDFVRKAGKSEVASLQKLIKMNGLTAAKCGLDTSSGGNSNQSRGFGSRGSSDESSNRGFGSNRSGNSDRGFGSRGESSSRTSNTSDLNIPMCVLAAESGDADAQLAASDWFTTGEHGLPIDQKYAESLLARAANNGGSDTARAKLLENLWASGDFESRLKQIKKLLSDSENENLIGQTLTLEANYLLELIDQDRWSDAPGILTDKGTLDLIFENVSVNSIAPRSRLILFGSRETLSQVAQANAESMDFGARDLEDAYIDLYKERDQFLRTIAKDALYFAAKKGNCEVLALVGNEKRTFDEISDDLVKKYGADCLLKTPDDAMSTAEERIRNEDYPGAASYLAPLLDDGNCQALKIAIQYQGESKTVKDLVDDYLSLVPSCSEIPEVALESLNRDMDSRNRQALFDKADDLCRNKSVLGACSVAAELLADKENKLDQQTAKTSFNAPSIQDLRKDAIDLYLLPAAKQGNAKAALSIIKTVLIDKNPGTSFFKKDAEMLIERLNSDRNPNGKVLKLVSELKVENPVDILNNIGNSFTGKTGRKCEELKGYRNERGLEQFVLEEMESVFKGPFCGTNNR